MKKVLFIAIAAVAFTMTSCNQKTDNASVENATDSVAVAVDEAKTATDELAAALESNDANAFQKAYETAMEKAKNMDPAIVKEYLTKVQEFVKNNIDKVKAFAGSNAALVSTVDAFANMPAENLNNVTETIGKMQEQLKGTADEAVNEAKDKANEAVNEAKDKANEAVNKATEKAVEKTNEAIKKNEDKLVNAVKGKMGM